MRKASIVFLILVGLLPAAVLGAQGARGAPLPTPTGARPIPRPAATLPIKLEDQWTTAVVQRDPRTFERLLAPNFVYTEDASVMSRSDVIRSVTGPDHVDWARNEGMKVHDFGDVQVITGILHLRGKGRQGSFDRRYRFTDTWQRRNSQWQIIAAQDYLIPNAR
jgi:ketosteroid isomerase-like protein